MTKSLHLQHEFIYFIHVLTQILAISSNLVKHKAVLFNFRLRELLIHFWGHIKRTFTKVIFEIKISLWWYLSIIIYSCCISYSFTIFLSFTFIESLKHPIFLFSSIYWVIVSFILLVRLDWPFQLCLLFLLSATLYTYANSSNNTILFVACIRSSSIITFSRTHQPFINFFISFKNTIIFLLLLHNSLLSNYKVNFCYNWSSSFSLLLAFSLSSMRRLRLFISIIRGLASWLVCLLVFVTKLTLNYFLFRQWKWSSSSLERELKYISFTSLVRLLLLLLLIICSRKCRISWAWISLLRYLVLLLFLFIITLMNTMNICWSSLIKVRRRGVVSYMRNLGDQ